MESKETYCCELTSRFFKKKELMSRRSRSLVFEKKREKK